MTDRRPHWDDYLLASVMIHCNDIYQCYAVIAAVEDWQKKRWASITQSPMEVAVQFNALEAAIQRVRGLHHFVVDEIETREGPEDVQHCAECGYIPTDEEPCPTIRILDGAA